MKKTILFSLGIAAVMLASCSDEYEEWSAPQSNPQESAYTVALTAESAGAADFNSVTSETVPVVKTTVTSSKSVASEKLGLTLYNANKNVSYSIAANADGSAKVEDLAKYVTALYGEQESVINVPVEVSDTITLSDSTSYVRTASFTAPVTLKKEDAANFLYIGEKRLKVNNDKTGYQGYAYLSAGTFEYKDKDGNVKGSVTIPSDGVYKIDVDAASFAATATEVKYISLIGSFNGWGADTDLTYDKANDCWTATGVVFPDDNTSFKIRLNHDWTISWGGSLDTNDYGNLTYNKGQNLSINAGTYDFTFKLNYEGTMTLTFVKK